MTDHLEQTNQSIRTIPDNQTAEQILADIQAHMIPGGLLIPAAVGELVRLQDKGYRIVVMDSV